MDNFNTTPKGTEAAAARHVLGLPEDAPLTFDDRGWTSRVYLYQQGQKVVKFPRTEAVKEEYRAEAQAYVRINRLLDSLTSAPVRLPVLLSLGPETSYLAYAGIPGKTLDLAPPLSEAELKRVGQQLGSFLKQLRGLRLDHGHDHTLKDDLEELQHKYGLGKDYLSTHLDTAEQKALKTFVQQTVPDILQQLGYKSVLCHGDLGYWNMVYEPGQTIGLIDFGDVGYYDESLDFVGLQDEQLQTAAFETYGASEPLKEKTRWRQRVLPVLELPFYLGKNNEQGALRTLKRIQDMLKSLL